MARKSGRVVYGLSSDGNDGYADMTLLSVWSLEHSNPEVSAVILIDSISAALLRKIRHPLLTTDVEIIEIESIEGSKEWRSRFLKTQVRRRVSGPVLFLDSDTLVRDDVERIFETKAGVGGVANHNASGLDAEISKEQMGVLVSMGWERAPLQFVNSGVLFLNDCSEVYEFSELWHELWLKSAQRTGRYYDQPALSQALCVSNVSFKLLDRRYNAQIHARPSTALGAAVWHIYRSDREAMPRTVFEELVYLQRSGRTGVRGRVADICAASHPWVAKNPMDRYAIHHMMSSDRILHGERWERLWLAGEYRRLAHQVPRRFRALLSAAWRAALRPGPPAS
jgi:hypothetical protein